MKKSPLFLSALAALSFAGSASALDVNVERILVVPGLTGMPFATDLVGTAVMTALGTSRQYCQYLMEWTSPFNPNDVELCVLRERKHFLAPSCIANSQADFTTFVGAGSGAKQPTCCTGFDNLGVAYEGITLLFGEDGDGLHGIGIYPTAIPLILPIEALAI